MTYNVKIEGWGDHCGPKPVSHSSKKKRSVEIEQHGKHLVFSKGGLRTDQCGSPNPRLSSVSSAAGAGSWKRLCETPKNDPKYERGEYKLVAKGDNKLEYTANSTFNWTLKGDHCVASSVERRAYVRVSKVKKAKSKEKPKVGKNEKKLDPPGDIFDEDDEEDVKPGCEEPGPARRLILQPRKARLGPSERVCFRSIAVDENGCRTTVKANWTVTQGGRAVSGLLTATGCFRAGDTAAESEGDYKVVARAEGRTGSAEVSVLFPDLGELLAARLKPLEDEDNADNAETAPVPVPVPVPVPDSLPSTAPTAGSTPTASATATAKDNGWSFWLIVGFLGAALTGFTIVIIMSLRRNASRKKSETEDFDNWLDAETDSAKSSEPDSSPAKKIEEKVVCPKCGEAFPKGSKFCPHDGATLDNNRTEPDSKPMSSDGNGGMVCPVCHRGYDISARFCPHDSEKLVSYTEWRSRKHPD
ncbi:MAG: zinc ribbon domain-containing protein [Deltaproteobacteria bacterium]|nr:zinc ribbon domain-containing protein [Deltaproteobacteria bacterium]